MPCLTKGAVLERLVFRHPLYERDSLAVIADYVTLEAGTGAVHIAPGHGSDDYVAGQQNGLDVLSPVDNEGKFTAEVAQETRESFKELGLLK